MTLSYSNWLYKTSIRAGIMCLQYYKQSLNAMKHTPHNLKIYGDLKHQPMVSKHLCLRVVTYGKHLFLPVVTFAEF